MKQIGIEATVCENPIPDGRPPTAAAGHAQSDRHEGDPRRQPPSDADLIENYACGSPRNYTHYCNDAFWSMVEQQSQQVDRKKRQALVQKIQRKLEEDAARPVLNWRIDYFTAWPHVRNIVPHQSIYNWARLQEAWISR